MALLEVDNLQTHFFTDKGQLPSVDGVSFEIEKGETVGIVGESGCGKSVTAMSILRLIPQPPGRIVGGQIRFKGRDLATMPIDQLRKVRGNEISVIFQEPMTSLNPLQSIEKQINEVLGLHKGLTGKAATRRTLELLELVGIPEPLKRLKALPHELSGGQRQRVMIAMALSNNPKLLIADEPTTALDVTTQRQILDLIKDLQEKRGMGVLFITHDIGVVADIADKVVVLKQGRIEEQGPAASVLDTPTRDYTRMLLDAVPGRGSVQAGETHANPLLEVKGLQKEFVTRQGLFAPPRRVLAAGNLNLTLREGETLAVVGESGSGKSTLARMVLRLIEADDGAILWHGKNVRGMGREALRQYRRRAQIVFQDPYASLDPRIPIGESIARGPMIFGTPRAEAEADTRQWLDRVGLSPAAFDRFPHEFSGGQRQRVCIARALIMKPELVIADEAVSALDVSVQSQVLDLLSDLKSEMGLSMLFITHDLRVAREIADRIIVMQSGRIVEMSAAQTLFDAPQEDYTRRLLDAVPGRDFFARQQARAAV